jgi:hypothetical protein
MHRNSPFEGGEGDVKEIKEIKEIKVNTQLSGK